MKRFFIVFIMLLFTTGVYAADQKLTALTADLAPTSDDLVYVVDDVAGTPTEKKVLLSDLPISDAAQTEIDTKQDTLTNSAGLRTALSDPNGTGLATFGTSPTLVTPDIGTPSAGVLTNATGLPYTGLADGTDGELITWAADGTAAAVAVGTINHVLTSNGVGAAPTFQASTGSGDVTAAAVITATAIVVGDDGAKGVKETNVLIDGSDNITGVASIDITKVSGVAGLISVKEAETTSALYTGLMGPVDMTVAESYSIQFPNAQPAGSFLVAATPAGTGDPNGNKVAAGSWVLFPVEIGAAASDETTDLTTGESKVTFRAPFAFTLTEVRANVNTAPTGTGITVDIEEGGTTVLSTLITIDVSEFTSEDAATPPVISDSAIADDASITIDIDVIGSTIAGKGLKIWLIGTRPL